MRNAVFIGGDSDTITAFAESVAEARFGIPRDIAAKAWFCLRHDVRQGLTALTALYAQEE